jgi:hypothetical protein
MPLVIRIPELIEKERERKKRERERGFIRRHGAEGKE